jgi:hypothetical protein
MSLFKSRMLDKYNLATNFNRNSYMNFNIIYGLKLLW